jgi:hypothetical protein
MHCDSDIFEGFRTKGEAETVIKSGQIAVDKGRFNERLPAGRFLYRQ